MSESVLPGLQQLAPSAAISGPLRMFAIRPGKKERTLSRSVYARSVLSVATVSLLRNRRSLQVGIVSGLQ